MENLSLWKQRKEWASTCKWVELSHELSADTPHWSGFPAMSAAKKFDYPDGFLVHEFSLVSQYGTHVDAPSHFVQGAPSLESIGAGDMVLPLCVIDIRDQVRQNVDHIVTVQEILDWEAKYGQIPAGAFVATCSDWSKRTDLDNCDAAGHKHFPGWGLEALKFLVEQRNVGAIGHETSDTDAPVESVQHGYLCEYYILEQGRYQIELLRDLDQVPPVGALIFCGFPRAKGAPGFTARCFALCPRG